ncbi:SagB family peptide dehydrogenase [Aerosakkonema sp. BLCC-F183]|uniref:SagB family peptide dehydrogenase n=1 Tax=Aerosakkonema sp. BLCC-F183 TaxID=3342834 RepID=UPI0035BB83AA
MCPGEPFLYRTARVRATFPKDEKECSDRPYANGGACYELEFYIIVNRCENIPEGLYHYCPLDHQLCKISDKNSYLETLLKNAETATVPPCNPQILIILATRFPRVSWGYESMAYALTLKHVGVLYQTMYLVATAMNLAPCAIGGGNSDLFATATGCDYYAETSVGEFMLGSRA